MARVSAAPSPTRRALRWGIGDVVWVWFVGLAAGAVVGSIAATVRGRTGAGETDAVDLVVGLFAQNAAIVGSLVVVSRVKGLGTLRDDFGLVVRVRDWPWLAGGVLLQVLSLGLVALLDAAGGGLDQQQAVETLQHGRGPELVLLVLGVALLAPLTEELLFRGLLLRAVARRTTVAWAVVVTAVVFALGHLLDPSTSPLLAPFLLLGVIAAIRSVRTGELSQSILLHAGFNLLSAIVLVVG